MIPSTYAQSVSCGAGVSLLWSLCFGRPRARSSELDSARVCSCKIRSALSTFSLWVGEGARREPSAPRSRRS